MIGPIDAQSTKFLKYLQSMEDPRYVSNTTTPFDVTDDVSDSEQEFNSLAFGGLSQTVACMSPHRLLAGNETSSNQTRSSAKDTENYHLFMSLNDAAVTHDQICLMRNTMIEMTNRFLSQNRKRETNKNEMTFLGEDESGGQRNGKRHRQWHEKR
jgi:hypothetical protein